MQSDEIDGNSGSNSMTTMPPTTAREHPNGNRTTPELPHPGAKVVPW
jgi:hypothetical protein